MHLEADMGPGVCHLRVDGCSANLCLRLSSFPYMKLEVASVFLCHKKVSRARISAYCISGLCKAVGKGHPCNHGEAKTFGGSQNASF